MGSTNGTNPIPIGAQGITLSTTNTPEPSTTACRFPVFCRRTAKESEPHDNDTTAHQQQPPRRPINVARVTLDSRTLSNISVLTAKETNKAKKKIDSDVAAYFNNVVKAAWAVLLRCYTGQDQVSFSFSFSFSPLSPSVCNDSNDANDNDALSTSTILRFDFTNDGNGGTLSVADAVAASGKDPSPGRTAVWGGRGREFIVCGEVGGGGGRGIPTPGAIDTAVVVVSSGRSVPKLEVCAPI